MSFHRSLKILKVAGVLGCMSWASAALADTGLPSTIAMTAYGVGSNTYTQAVAIGNALKSAYNVDVRVLPGKNDISRHLPLRAGHVHFTITGLSSYQAQEAIGDFAAREWGPQPIRLVMMCDGGSNVVIGTAADANIKTLKDLKGERVAWVVGGGSLNENVTAMLAFAGLTWDDVIKVEFPGYKDAWQGVINNQADAAFTNSASGLMKQLEASPRGLYWPPVPHSDKEGWARLKELAPYYVPSMGTVGAGMSKENPHEGASYPIPILITQSGQSADLVYEMTKAMVDQFPKYKDGAPGIAGFALDRQNLTWVVPYHEGAIRYFKEKGKWSPEAQAHNDKLVERQTVLAKAWEELKARKPASAEFKAEWRRVRAAALRAAGFYSAQN